MSKRIFKVLSLKLMIISFYLFSCNNAFSQMQITPNLTAQQLAEILGGPGVTITNVSSYGTVQSRGSFTTVNFGIHSGIILSTGNVMDAAGPNSSTSTSISNGTGSDPHLANLIPGYTLNDATYLQFDFIPESDVISFKYIFASEEYPEYVGSSFNDVFGFFLSGPNPSGGNYNFSNIALIPGSSLPVSIDNINAGTLSQYYINNNTIGQGVVEYDGYTIALYTFANVVPNQQYTIKIAIADAGDSAYDSAVFLESGSLVSKASVSGYVYEDDNNNCIKDSLENISPYNIIKIQNDSNEIYTMTNQNGWYGINLPLGDYIIEAVEPPLRHSACPLSGYYDFSILSINNNFDTLDIGYNNIADCPYLNVLISGGPMRPCFNTTINVKYSNQGTILAENALIEVEFDNDMTPVSATLPWSSVQGNIYTFNVGDLDVFETGSFNIVVGIACDNNLIGHTRCADAQIFADNTCNFVSPGLPDTTQNLMWDHSSVSVEGECVGDSLACFKIRNNGVFGGGNMLQANEYRIYANDTLVSMGTFQLLGGDSLVICWPTNGRAIRLEADQSVGHPGFSQPRETIENCGDFFGTSLGYITTVPFDDNNADVDVFCQILTASFDPNEKTAQPSGVTTNNYISNDAVLSYHINFQNTGTDTAFTVIIVDTLSAYLDPATIINGPSSHNNIFDISGQGILTWTFQNILLPDSATNEDESKGFVSFQISQKPLLMPENYGTLISNEALIYFDYNPPVVTNQVDLILWKFPTVITNILQNPILNLLIYPNPAVNNITVDISDNNGTFPLDFKLLDITGKQVKTTRKIYQNKFNINVSDLQPGLYLYQLMNNKTVVKWGKIIIQK